MLLQFGHYGKEQWYKIQSSSCKICHKYLPSHQQCIQHNWPTRTTRLRNSKTKFLLFKIIHDQTCIPFTDITPPTIITWSKIATRSDPNNLPVIFARTDIYKFSFGPHACNIWNNLPSCIKEVTSIDTLKTSLGTNDYVFVCDCAPPPVYSLRMQSSRSNIK